MRRTAFCYGLLFILFANAVLANDRDSAAVKAAKQHFQEGMHQFDEKNYAAAVKEFRKAYEIKPTWKLRYNIGQAEAAAKRYGLALEEFEAYLGEGGDEVLIERERDVLREIDRLRMLVGVLDIKAPDGTEIFIDDLPRGTMPLSGVLRVAVGTHHLWMRLDGKAIYDDDVRIAGAVRTILDVTDVENGNTQISTEVDDTPKVGPPIPEEDDIFGDANSNGDAEGLQTPVGPDEKEKKERFAFIKSLSRRQRLFLFGGIASATIGLGGIGAGVWFTHRASIAAEKRDDYAAEYRELGDRPGGAYAETLVWKQQDIVDRNERLLVTSFIAGGVFAAAGATLLVLYFKQPKGKVALMPTFNGVVVSF